MKTIALTRWLMLALATLPGLIPAQGVELCFDDWGAVSFARHADHLHLPGEPPTHERHAHPHVHAPQCPEASVCNQADHESEHERHDCKAVQILFWRLPRLADTSASAVAFAGELAPTLLAPFLQPTWRPAALPTVDAADTPPPLADLRSIVILT